MNEISDIRLHNARTLAREFETLAAFANAIDRSPTQVSRFMGRSPSKKIGDTMARHIEKSLRKPRGWLDTDRTNTTPQNLLSTIGTSDEITLLKTIIKTVEEIAEEENIKLTAEEKAKTIIGCLKICSTRNPSLSNPAETVASAIYALKL